MAAVPSSPVYVPLASPLPSHPGFPHPASSHASTSTAHLHPTPAARVHGRARAMESSGALRALGTILLGPSAAGLTRRQGKDVATQEDAAGVSKLFKRRWDKFVDSLDSAPSQREQEVRPAESGVERDDTGLPDGDAGRRGIQGRKEGPRYSRQRDLTGIVSPDLPPSPSGVPGAWTWDFDEVDVGSAPRGREASGALLLPPPFLDESSSRESFEGILGTRSARETSRRARVEARAYARDRPPPPALPHSLLATLSKLVTALGPPGGLDSGPMYRAWKDDSAPPSAGTGDGGGRTMRRERKRTERAERGLKGFEMGERMVRGWAERLRDGQELSPLAGTQQQPVRDAPIPTPLHVRAATPTSLFDPSPALPLPLSGLDHFLDPTGVPLVSPGLDAPLKPKLEAVQGEETAMSPFPQDDECYFAIGNGDDLDVPLLDDVLDEPYVEPAAMDVLTPPRPDRQTHDFLLWLLLGKLAPASSHVIPYSGLVGVTLHLFGFIAFLLVHLLALVTSSYAIARSTALFTHWAYLNLTLQTDLSVTIYNYLGFCRDEWEAVFGEDDVSLGWLNVVVSLAEMGAVQAMSKERYLAEGPGELRLLNGEEEEALGGRRHSLRAGRRKSSAFGERVGLTRRWTHKRGEDEDGQGDSLLVTGGNDEILEGSILHDNFDPTSPQHYMSPRAHGLQEAQRREAREDFEGLPPLELSETLGKFSFAPQSISADFGALAEVSAPVPLSPPLRPVPVATTRPLNSLLKTLKRHVRLATASYGLHSYLLQPPTPLFTPSGATLPHKIFSHLAGIGTTDSVLHVAIQKNYLGVPSSDDFDVDTYSPQFYLIRDDVNCEVVCVIRGTQSLSDIRTDLEAGVVDVTLPALDREGEEKFKIHGGILAAARRLLSVESLLFGKLVATLEENPCYGINFSGHSLGAAIASTLALLIGEYFPASSSLPRSSSSTTGTWLTNKNSGLPAGRPIRALAFAHPTTVDIALARRCALGTVPLVLTVSLGSDIVVRMGVPQVREVRRALGRLAKQRRKFLSTRAKGEHGQSAILSSWWRWKRLGGGEGGKNDEVRELEQRSWEWRMEMEGFGSHALPVPARAGAEDLMLIPCGKVLHLDRLPTALWEQRKAAQEALEAGAEEEDDDDEETLFFGLYEVLRPEKFFTMPFLEADMVKTHLPKSYLDAVESLG